MLQKQKKCAWEINSGVIKMYGTCHGKRACLKKEIKELETTEHVCSWKYVRFTKGTFHFGSITWILCKRSKQKSKWYVIERYLNHLVTTGWTFQGKETAKYTPSLFRYHPQERNQTCRYTYEIGGRGFHTRKNPSSWEEGERIQKKMIHTETGTWVNIVNVTIREVKACNRVNVKRFNILVNCRVQSFFFPQNLKFSNTFVAFLIIPFKFDLPRSGDS